MLTLALGIGANTAVFTVVRGVLLAPLPYHAPDEVVVLNEVSPQFPNPISLSCLNYPDWRDSRLASRHPARGTAWQGCHDRSGASRSRAVESLLFEVEGLDAISFGGAAALLLVAALAAAVIPAARAARVAPLVALGRSGSR